jgi:glycine cleavage system aminomethyltransferase T
MLLCGFKIHGPATIDRAASVKSKEGAEVGRITSVTFSPTLGSTIALGYVRYEQSQEGNSVQVSSGGNQVEAAIATLPFVHGSWYPQRSV